jgi:hypothetical protein
MPWYYAGPEAKPVGPVTLDELHACRVRGIVRPETYVIEHTGQPVESLTWKRYQDIFPSSPGLPPLPALSPPPAVAPAIQPQFIPPQAIPPQVISPRVNPPHPLFPSAAPSPTGHSVFPPTARPDPYYNVKPTNGLCAWGFGLALAAFFFAFITCGIGGILALPSLLLCIVGLAQVQKNREQSGQGLAIAGLVLSGLALLVSLIIIVSLARNFKMHDFTVTEQTTNDSD